MENDEDYYFGIFDPANDALIGTINLFQVLRGSLQSAFIGYFWIRSTTAKATRPKPSS